MSTLWASISPVDRTRKRSDEVVSQVLRQDGECAIRPSPPEFQHFKQVCTAAVKLPDELEAIQMLAPRHA